MRLRKRMALKSSSYKNALKASKDSTFNIKRIKLLFLRVAVRIESITIFLAEDIIADKILKNKISLLSSLLDVKRKLRTELRELTRDSPKGEDSLGEILK